jgi:TfoX/Sxy family transcriptional regulator of competence genes
MKLDNSPPALEKTFEEAFPDDPRAVARKMFGYPAGFVNGNMFAGSYETAIVLRLGDADRETITGEHGALPFEPMGRPMNSYVMVPSSIPEAPRELRAWVQRAFEHAASLAPKEKKAPNPKKPARQSVHRRPP